MRDKALVIVVIEAKGKSHDEVVQTAINRAQEDLDKYVDTFYEGYDKKRDSVKDCITFGGGKLGGACRAAEFEKFTNELPSMIIQGILIAGGILQRYGVQWEPVVEEHIRASKSMDTCEAYQEWFVMAEVDD